MIATGLGKRICDARGARGFTRSDFARLVGVTPTAAWNWELNGTEPRPQMLTTIAKVLGVSETYLATGIDSGPTSGTRDLSAIIEHAQNEIAAISGVAARRVKVRVEISPA